MQKIPPRILGAILILAAMVLVMPVAADLVWQNETVDSVGSGSSSTSLAFDNSGNPAISYYDYSNTALKYAVKEGNGWSFTTIDQEGTVGFYSSLAIDQTGYPSISYRDFTNNQLKYAWKNVTGWHNTSVETGADMGYYTSLALNNSDNPSISYFDYDNSRIKYAWKNGSEWETSTVDSAGLFSYPGTSLAFDQADNPAIAYCDRIIGIYHLKYAWKDGSTWQKITIDDVDGGTNPSLAFNDTSGYPAISYCSYGDFDLKFAWKNETGWHTVKIDEGFANGATSLAFHNGLPSISYYADKNMSYAWMDGDGWHTMTVDDGSTEYDYVGKFSSLAFTSDGYPAISYLDDTTHALKYAVASIPPTTISVTSTPAGAAIYLNEANTGEVTPADLTDMAAGTYNVTVLLDGYLSGMNTSVVVTDNTTTIVNFALTALEGNISVHSTPSGAWVWLDGVNMTEQTNSTLTDIGAGSHDITVMKEWYETPTTETITVNGGGTTYVAFDLVPVGPVAGFSASPVSGAAPLSVQFTETTTGIVDTWAWDFGDGATSNEQNPTHSYASAGTYTVTLVVTNAAGDDTITKTDSITVTQRVSPSSGGSSFNAAEFDFDGTGTLLTSGEGKVLHVTTIRSDDGIATLTIPQGTLAGNGDGASLVEITIKAINASETPANMNGAFTFAGYAYRCTPSGATFAPSILLAFRLTADEWDALDAEELSIRFYDEEAGEWVELPATVNTVSRTITAELTHFSIYGLFTGDTSTTTVSAAQSTAVPDTAASEVTQTTAPTTDAPTAPEPTQSAPLVCVPLLALGAFALLWKRH